MSTRNINNPPRGDFFRRNGAFHQIGLVKATTTPSMMVQINPILLPCFGTEWIDYVGGLSPEIIAPPTSYAKWDLVGLNSFGNAEVIQGEPAANDPQFPVPPKNFLPLAAIFIESDDTEITEDMVFDIRPFLSLGNFPVDHSELTGTSAENLHEIASIRNLLTELSNRVLHSEMIAALKAKADIDGTPATEFTLNRDETGVPATTVTFKVKRGDQFTVGFRWNEQIDRWQYTNDGSNWIDFSNTGYITAANAVNLGTVFLSVNPIDPANPVAVGTNDPRLLLATNIQEGLVKLSVPDISGIVVADSDPRNSDARNPLAHSASHISGSDQIPVATTVSKGLMGETQVSRLNEINDDRLFNDVTQKLSVISHLTNMADPHASRSSHESAFDHRLLYWNTQTSYMVGPEVTTDKFNTIQSAINAVVADGANLNGKKVVIFVKPGIYVENITLQPNITLSSLTGLRNHTTVINGSITMNFSVDGCAAGINGIQIASNGNPGIFFTGSNKQALHFYNNSMTVSSTTSAIFSDNTNIQSKIYMENCVLDLMSNCTGFALDMRAAAGIRAYDSRFNGENGKSVNASNSAVVECYQCELAGRFNVENTATLKLFLSFVKGASSTTNSTGYTVAINVIFEVASGNVVDGSGAFLYSNIAFTSLSKTLASTLNGNAGPIEIPSTTSSIYTSYTSGNPIIWSVSSPQTVKEAIDRIASAISLHLGTPIP